ncbi:hypothetical protein [Faucicola boevrei]|nr:hypothetical protein [Moraxella boevrei]
MKVKSLTKNPTTLLIIGYLTTLIFQLLMDTLYVYYKDWYLDLGVSDWFFWLIYLAIMLSYGYLAFSKTYQRKWVVILSTLVFTLS